MLNSIYEKLQDIKINEPPEQNEEVNCKNKAIAIDNSAVMYINNEEDNESNSRDSKTPNHSKIQSRTGNEYIATANDIQRLIDRKSVV